MPFLRLYKAAESVSKTYSQGESAECISVVSGALFWGACQQESHSGAIVSQSYILYHSSLL